MLLHVGSFYEYNTLRKQEASPKNERQKKYSKFVSQEPSDSNRNMSLSLAGLLV